MAMRVCVFCKQDVTYERENRNLLKGGAVGFWTNPITGQATCPDAPVDPATGQQLHSVGDVHTPPVHDPEQLEAFLNGTYVPPAPSKPCGQMYGLDDKGEFLECGLDAGHDGDCAPGTPVQASVQNAPDPSGTEMVMMDVSYGTETFPNGSPKEVTISAQIDGVAIGITFDKEKVGPSEVMGLLEGFTEAAKKAVLVELLGPEAVAAMEAVQEAAEAARKPEPPKILEDPADIEKFLNGDD